MTSTRYSKIAFKLRPRKSDSQFALKSTLYTCLIKKLKIIYRVKEGVNMMLLCVKELRNGTKNNANVFALHIRNVLNITLGIRSSAHALVLVVVINVKSWILRIARVCVKRNSLNGAPNEDMVNQAR